MVALYGLIGEKLSHSISPQIHALIFKKMNIDGDYRIFEVERDSLEEQLTLLKAVGAVGINVTIPYKVSIIEYLDEIGESARKLGAVNTIHFKDGKVIGHNTDYFGFGLMLKKNGIQVLGKKAVILGSGGVSKTVFHYLLDEKIEEVCVVVRDINKNDKNTDWIKEESFKNQGVVKLISYEALLDIEDKDILVNCTPCGMYPNFVDDSPVSEAIVRKFNTIVDLIYNPEETRLLNFAKKNGVKAINGLYMLVAQAVVAEEIWNNKSLGIEFIDNIYKKVQDSFYIGNKNIVLIGMPGCGKTVIGKEISKRTDLEFFDVDKLIEKQEGKSITDIFKLGEEHFRDIESSIIKKLSCEKHIVISTGGGAIKRPINMEVLRKNSVIIFIDRPIEEILKDVDTSKRPLLKEGKENLYNIYKERYDLYKLNCDMKVVNNKDINLAVDKLLTYIKTIRPQNEVTKE